LAEDGAAVVLSSHDLAEVEELCTDVTIVHRGKVVLSSTVDELRMVAPDAVHTLRTSDDRSALMLASEQPGVKVVPTADGTLEVSAEVQTLDAYVIALGRAGIAVRGLERCTRSLESLFLQLTGSDARREEAALVPSEASDGPRASPGNS
jgi:ABC-2 type transport system ATP-binding protein